MSNQEWGRFSKEAAKNMLAAQRDEISLEELTAFFEKAPEISDKALRQFLVRYVWEIDGSPGTYQEILELFRSGVTEVRLVKYFNSE